MSLDKKVSDLLPMQIPDYVQEFYPLFVIFVTKYFEWLEQDGNPQQIIQNIQLNADIDTTATSLATKFMAMYAPNLPQTSALNRPVLIKHFRDFYLSKGSEESFKFFFRAFFNDEITVKLPGNQLFKTSDGDWYIEKDLRVNAVTGDPRKLTALQIKGTESNATAIVEEVVNSYNRWDLRLQNRSLQGTFSSSETITATYYDFVNNTSSEIVVVNTQPLLTLPGRQRGNSSLLSADQVLQDSIYWQKFSYVLRTRVNLDRWKDAVLEQLHPTGRNLFGEILIENSTSLAVSSTTQFSQSTAIESQVKLFTNDSKFYLVPGISWDRLANYRTGTSTTTSAGSIFYDEGYTFAGENITFALQTQTDADTILQEDSLQYSSITGTVSVNVTTSVTATNRDSVSYSMPVTSITGTVNAVVQVGGDSITLTGTSTVFGAEILPNSTWRRVIGQDAGLNPIYEYNTAVLTVGNIRVTGTLTMAAQTPTAPDYLLYVSGTNTKFRTDLLIGNETTAPVVPAEQTSPLLYIDNWLLTGDVTFTSGSTSVVGVNTLFSEISPVGTSTLTVIKPLRGVFTQVSSIPALVSGSYDIVSSVAVNTTISGTTLSFSTTTSNYSAIAVLTYGTDRSTRYDIPTPFPVQFLTTSVTRLYVHASGFIASDTSAPSYFGTAETFRPFLAPFVGVDASRYNLLDAVYWDTQGTAPDRYFTIHYDGRYNRLVNTVVASYNTATDNNAVTSMVIRGSSVLGSAQTRTSGTASNGYYAVPLPWSIWYNSTAYSTIFVSHNSRVGFGDWIAYGSSWTITNNGLASSITMSFLSLCNGNEIISARGSGTLIRAVQRLFYATLGSAPNRSFIVRFEGDSSTGTAAGNSRCIWEMEFKETDLSSITVHFAHPAQTSSNTNEVLGSIVASTISWIQNDAGTGWTSNTTYNYSNQIAYSTMTRNNTGIWSSLPFSPITSGLVSFNYTTPPGAVTLLTRVTVPPTYINQLKWEMAFPENSASPIILRNGARTDGNYSINPSREYYEYGRDTGTTYVPRWEWAESRATTSLVWTQITTPNTALGASSTYTAFFTKFDPVSALTTTIPVTSGGVLLLRGGNDWLGGVGPINSTRIITAERWGRANSSGINGGVAPGSLGCDTSTGLISRYPRDGYNATTANPDPNPTIPVTSLSATYSYTLEGLTTSTAGLAFVYGSSALTQSRFVQTVPQFGNNHTFTIEFLVGTGFTTAGNVNYSTLNQATAGQNLELWYYRGENPQPPTAGQSPSTLGWTQASTLWFGGSSTGYSFGGIVPQKFFKLSTAQDTSVTWLVWQRSWTGTGTSNTARFSEYLLTHLFVSSSMSTAGNELTYFPANRLQLGSGSVVRLANRTTKAGATVQEDFYVAENPRSRQNLGDLYLVLRPVSTVTSVPYVASINSWQTGGSSGTTNYGTYNLALTNIPLYIVETRTIANVANETTLTVTAAWSSTSNRAWGGSGGSGYTTRIFAINSVINDTGLTLRNAGTQLYNAPVSAAISFTSNADRRFLVVNINSDTDLQVSGGGIYANFSARPALFARIESGIEGYRISGYHNASNLTSDTTWVSSGLPGIDITGVNRGTDLSRLTVDMAGSSFTVVRVIDDTTILVTGSTISTNFWDTSMVSRFPAASSEITITGTGTKFLETSTTVSGITTYVEEVITYDGDDQRTGYLNIDGQVFRVISIQSDTTLLASSTAVSVPISGAAASSFARVRRTSDTRVLIVPGGPSFDKFGSQIFNDAKLIVQDPGVNYDLFKELYNSTSSLSLTSSAIILNTSISVTAGSSVVLMITWNKDQSESGPEDNNKFSIAVTSTGTFIANFDDEVQRNHQDVAVGRSIAYPRLVYLGASFSVTSTNSVAHGDTTGTAIWSWVPANIRRAGTYSRFSAVLSSSEATSLNILVSVDPASAWESLSTDFLNITVVGTS